MKATTMEALKNKFIVCPGRTGQIVAVFDDAVLVQFDVTQDDPDAPPSYPMELVCMQELMHAEADGFKVWGFFDSRAELDAYLAWLENPATPARVIKMVPKKPPPGEPS